MNTSAEESKSGVAPEKAANLCSFIANECAALQLAGLMTIGAPDYSGCRAEDFEALQRCREEAAKKLELSGGASSLALSMGMSSDFENAIRNGSTSVRVGSTIFGARNYAAK